MCCKGGFDIRDYFWGELPERDRAEADRHVVGCGICSEELAELKTGHGLLMTLQEQEPPQRIGFVSDKVFEPSPVKRWLESFWTSGARLGFASAAMLSCAILVHSARPPQTVERAATTAPQIDIQAVVNTAVKTALAEQDKKTSSLLAVAEEKHRMEEKAMALQVSDYLTNVEKRVSYTRAIAMDYGSGSGKGGQ